MGMKIRFLVTTISGLLVLSLAGCGSQPTPSAEGGGYLQGAVEHYQQVPDNLEQAARDGETAVLDDPTNTNGYVALANTFLHLRQPMVAAWELKTATNLKPHDAILWNDLGMLYWSVGQSKLANAAWRQAVKQNAGNWMAWDGLAEVAMSQAHWTLATADLDQSLVVGGSQGPTLDFLGQEAMSLGDWQSAATYFQDTIQTTPQWWQGYYDLARVDLHWGEINLAESNLHAALNVYPGSGKSWLLLQSMPQPVAANGN